MGPHPGDVTALSAVIDLHTHILPGVDDGPASPRDSLAMARAAAADGTRTMACTPHRRAKYPTRASRVHEGIADLQPRIDAEGIDLRLVPGLEIAIEEIAGMDDEELLAATLGDGPWLLLEMSFRGWPIDLPTVMTDLEIRGFRVLLAHPERCSSVQANPDRMRDLVGRGALVQVNARSITGDLGAAPFRAAAALLRGGMVHVIASDSHGANWRPPGLSDALATAADILGVEQASITWMVDDVPRAIIEGGDVRPPR